MIDPTSTVKLKLGKLRVPIFLYLGYYSLLRAQGVQ